MRYLHIMINNSIHLPTPLCSLIITVFKRKWTLAFFFSKQNRKRGIWTREIHRKMQSFYQLQLNAFFICDGRNNKWLNVNISIKHTTKKNYIIILIASVNIEKPIPEAFQQNVLICILSDRDWHNNKSQCNECIFAPVLRVINQQQW